MICQHCARAADIQGGRVGIAPCPHCGKTVTLTPKSKVLVYHKRDKLRCPGAKTQPFSHALCKGGTHCDCQCKGKDGPLGPRF